MMEWQAKFVAADVDLDGAPLLRREFALDDGHGEVVRASLRLSALGVIEAWIEGVPVSEDVLTPGWSSYEWRVRFATYDVTPQVALHRSQALTLGVLVGNGWYRGRLGWGAGAPPYGEQLAALVELRVLFEDGHEQVIGTDDEWKAGESAVTADSIYDGQSIDARRIAGGWNRAGFDDSTWRAVRVVDFDMAKLEAYIGPGVRRQMSRRPTRVWTSPSGKTLVDFGQNLVGWVRLRVAGPAGHTITVRHAEVLEHGELATRPLRAARATDTFTLSGGEDDFEPTMTFHGFRYIEVDGWPGGIDQMHDDSLEAVVVSSDLTRIGQFSCSNPMLNQLHENVVWGVRGNFLDVPTDCPQRDERLGWTGDIAVFAPTAAYLFDVEDFLTDWLRDLALEQDHHDGIVPFVVPDILKYMGTPPEFAPFESTAIWSDAAAWVPWALWQAYGHESVLAATYPSMASHARHVRSLLSASGVWDRGFQFGDWLDPDAPPDAAAQAKANPGVVATASAFRTARIVSDVATQLGLTEQAAEFAEMAEQLRVAFHDAYVGGDRITSDCTTVYSLAIVFGLLNADERVWAGRRLAELVAASDYRISTGFAGTPYICDALSSTGHVAEAYRLLLQTECPSWLYPVTMGATTIWERWDSMLPDGTVNPGEMTSFNHYALGAVADWIHRVVGGLSALEPGYRRILVDPHPGGGLEWGETSLMTPHGRAGVRWETRDDDLDIRVEVPEGATAVVPGLANGPQELGPGIHHLTRASNIRR